MSTGVPDRGERDAFGHMRWCGRVDARGHSPWA
jgi:hypothetical protein